MGGLSGLELGLLRALSGSGSLNLLSASLSLLSALLLLGSLDLSGTGSLADGSGLLALGNDLLPSGTNDGALNLDGLASALLGDLFGGSLLVEATEEDGPVELARVLLLEEVRLAFAVQQAEALQDRGQ